MRMSRRALAAAGALFTLLGSGTVGGSAAAQAARGTSSWTAAGSFLSGQCRPHLCGCLEDRSRDGASGINDPVGITAGPDGALWFTNCGTTTRSGGSPPPGRSPTTPAPASTTRRDHGRARRRAVVHQLRQQLDRADHHRRDGHQLHRPRHQQPAGDHGRARTARCGSPTTATTRSGGSPPPGWSPTTPAPASTTRRGSRPGRTARCGSPTTATTRSGGSPPPGSVTNYTGTGIDEPAGITAGPDGALWFTNYGKQLDRADHHRRDSHQLHRPGIDGPTGSRPARTAPCGSPTPGNSSIGRITTSGTVTNYTDTGIDDRSGSRPARTGRCGSPTRGNTRSGGSLPPGRSPSTPTSPRPRRLPRLRIRQTMASRLPSPPRSRPPTAEAQSRSHPTRTRYRAARARPLARSAAVPTRPPA